MTFMYTETTRVPPIAKNTNYPRYVQNCFKEATKLFSWSLVKLSDQMLRHAFRLYSLYI
jgi:hypothetical protein